MPAEGVEAVGGLSGFCFAVMGKGDGKPFGGVGNFLELGIGIEFDPGIVQGTSKGCAGLWREGFKEVGAALDLNHACTDALEELGELAGNDTASKNDYGFRDLVEVEDFVAGPEGYFF